MFLDVIIRSLFSVNELILLLEFILLNRFFLLYVKLFWFSIYNSGKFFIILDPLSPEVDICFFFAYIDKGFFFIY